MSQDRIARARLWIKWQQKNVYGTHWEGCEEDHGACAALVCLDELERLRAALQRIVAGGNGDPYGIAEEALADTRTDVFPAPAAEQEGE